LLMLAFEAIIGRRRPGDTWLERLGLALATAAPGLPDAGLRWFEREFIPLRNDAAHGREIARSDKATVQRFRSMIRVLLFHYVVFTQRSQATDEKGSNESARLVNFTEAFAECIAEARGPELVGDAGALLRLP